jgi:hypothetical protein
LPTIHITRYKYVRKIYIYKETEREREREYKKLNVKEQIVNSINEQMK